MSHYLDVDGLGEYTTKLTQKYRTIFAQKSEIGTPLVAATAAAMTDTNKIYVYTGSETGYTAGNWYYYNGSAWVSGGVYNSTAIETDTTLSESGMAADAKATGDAIEETNNDVTDLKNALLFENYIPQSGWWNKSYSSANGAISDSNIRISTIDYISPLIKSATPVSPYQIGIIAWDDFGTYQGMWSGTAWVKTGLTWQTSKITFSELPGNYKHRILLRRSNDAAITTEAYTNVTVEYVTEHRQNVIDAELARLSSEIKYYDCASLFMSGYYVTNTTYIRAYVSNIGYRSCILNVLPGEKLRLTGMGASSARLWAFADKNKQITRRADSGASLTNGELTVAEGECYFVYNADNSSNVYRPALSIEIDNAKALESLRADVDNIINRVVNAQTVRNDLYNDGIGNLLGVKVYNGGTESPTNYGIDNSKYLIDLGDFDRCHVYFKYKHNRYSSYSGSDVLVPLASVGTNNALNVQEMFRDVASQGGRIYKTAFFYPANATAEYAELVNPLHYRPINGSVSLQINYDGAVNNSSAVNVVFSSGSIAFNVSGSTVGTVTYQDSNTIQTLADKISAIPGFSANIVDSNGTVSDLLMPVGLTIDMIVTATREGATIYGKTIISIPYKIDKEWRSCEFIVDKTNQVAYVSYDGYTKRIPFATARALSDGILCIGGNYSGYGNIIVRDLELDINTYGDCEMVYGKSSATSDTDMYQLISKHNPRLIIFEGHGILVGSEADAIAAYEASGSSSTSQEGMQASTDRLNIMFRTLIEKGYKPVTLEDVLNWKKGIIDLPKRCFVPIFDDIRLVNYLDYDKRRPFVKYNVKPGLALISDITPTSEISANGTTYTAADSIHMINEAGWYICSHTSTHRNLSSYTVDENIQNLKNDVLSCDTHFIHSDVLVYPFGGVDTLVETAMADSDFALGITIDVNNRYNCRALTDYKLTRSTIATYKALADVLAPFI